MTRFATALLVLSCPGLFAHPGHLHDAGNDHRGIIVIGSLLGLALVAGLLRRVISQRRRTADLRA